MRLEAGFAPDAMHQILADAELAGELAAGPMRGAVSGLAAGGRKDAGAQLGGELGGRLPGTVRFESVEAAGEEALLPAGNGRRRGIELRLDGVVGGAVGEQQQDLGAEHESGRQRLRACDLFQLAALLLVQIDKLAFKRHTEKTLSL